jgi:hypothetical protein
VKGIFAATTRALASFIPSSITNYFSSTYPAENNHSEAESTVPDNDMDDLVESHNQWMNEVVEEAEFEYYDDEDYF